MHRICGSNMHYYETGSIGAYADGVINGRSQNAAETVRALTSGAGCDLVIKTAGTEITTRQSIHMTKKGSTIVLVGYSKTGKMTLPIVWRWTRSCGSRRCSATGISAPWPSTPWRRAR